MKDERIHKIVNGEDYYFCTKCKKWRPKSKFSIDNNSLHQNRGGLCNECKDCQRERYYHERQRLFEDNNLALRYKLQQALKGTRRRSKEKNIYNNLTIDYLLYLWERQKGCCALTGIPMTYKFYEGRVNTNVSVISEITKSGNAVATIPFLGNATFSKGVDKNRGEYVSIYDDWDYNSDVSGTPGDNIAKWIGGTPFLIYDRYYLDDYYGINSSASPGTYYGGYLPEITIKPLKK